MNQMVSPELATALARIAELEEEAARTARCHAAKEREHLSNSDELFRQIKVLKAEIAQGDAADRSTNALLDAYEEAIEASEVEIVEIRAKAYDAVREITDEMRGLVDERNELAAELKEAERDLAKLENEHEELKAAGTEEMAEARELLIDYLISIGEPVCTFIRPSRELQALCDALL